MQIISKLNFQARKRGLDVVISADGEVKLMNLTTKRYIHILPSGRVYSENTLGQDKALKELMNEFLVTDPFIGSVICLPCNVTLHVGKGALRGDVNFAQGCLMQCFANINYFKMVEDHDLLPSECRVEHEFDLSYKRRQAFIDACLSYLK